MSKLKEDPTRILAEYIVMNLKEVTENLHEANLDFGVGRNLGCRNVLEKANGIYRHFKGRGEGSCALNDNLQNATLSKPTEEDIEDGFSFNRSAIADLLVMSESWLLENEPNRIGSVSCGVYIINENHVLIRNISNITKSKAIDRNNIVTSTIKINSGGCEINIDFMTNSQMAVDFNYLLGEVMKHD